MADSLAVSATINGSLLTVTSVPSTTRKVSLIIQSTAGASDTSVSLAGLTTPEILIVKGAKGISFKLGSGGTDPINANPIAIVSCEAGWACTSIKLSNSDSENHQVEILAGE